ncbi:MAG: capsule assembly Wzi family protein [Gemmatimonadaceae bacterium]
MTPRYFLCALGALCFSARVLCAQAPTIVPMGDPAYGAVDQLADAGLVDTMLVGQRPYTRAEFADIVDQALRKVTGSPDAQFSPSLHHVLDALAERFTEDSAGAERVAPPRSQFIDAIALIGTSTNEQPRWVPNLTGAGGSVHAFIAPLALEAQSGGRDVMQGSTIALETWHHFAIGSHLMIEAHPRFRLSNDSSFSGEHTLSFQDLSASTQLSNMVVSVGRQHLEWGLSRHAKLFLSDNGPGLDMVRLNNARPWVLPGFLHVLGANSASIFLADLGPRTYFPHTKLIGYKWSLQPSANFELGLSALNFMGGAGAPQASFLKRLENAVLFPTLHYGQYQFSNTMAGLEMRYRVPALADAALYWEMDLDDFDAGRFRSAVWDDDGAHVFGLVLPRLGADGRLSATFEFHHTGTRFNRHAQFRDGPTVDGFLLGDPLGPDADGGYAYLDWNSVNGAGATLELADEAYRDNQYVHYHPGTSLVHVVQYLPQERHLRAMVTVHGPQLKDGLRVSVQGGLEHVNRFGFVDGVKRDQALVNVTLSYRFGR